MTSLAVLPLQRTTTDMDEDIYSRGGSNTSSFGGVPPQSPFMAANTNALSNLLNIPDSFVDHYSKANGSNSALNPVPSLFSDTFETYGSEQNDTSAQTINPFNIYAHPESLSGNLQQSNLQNTQQNWANVRPAPRSRITTLDDQQGSHPSKDDDYYLFNTDILPSQMMSSKNYFSPEEENLDSSMFIMNGDLDYMAPAPENEYMNLGEFEDAEDLSDDSDDDNYFQDEDDEEMNDFTMSFADLPDRAQNLDMSEGAKSPELYKVETPLDDMMYEENDRASFDRASLERTSFDATPYSTQSFDSQFDRESLNQFSRTQSFDSQGSFERSDYETPASDDHSHYGKMHLTEEDHKTAAEISALNPNHQCDLTNPATGKPCNKQFSRPYDLIRHQETIHAAKKKVFRCVICEGREHGGSGNGKSKTFSRGDALSRHIKVKHGFSGKEAVELINEAKKNVEYVHL